MNASSGWRRHYADVISGGQALMPRRAWVFATAFLLLLLPARTGVAIDDGNVAAPAVMTVTLFALPLLYTIPRGRVLWDRHTWWLLATQAVLTYLPFVLFGRTWIVGLSGLLGGLLLLTMRAPVSWILFVAVVALEGVLRLGVFGVYPTGGAQFVSWVFAVPIDMGLPLFGLVRLSDLVADLRAARTELVALAVTDERLQAAARLRAAIGGRLEAVMTRARAAHAELVDAPHRARELLTEAASVARRAAEQVRQTVAADQHNPGRTAPRRTRATVAPALALLVLIVDLLSFAGHNAVIVADTFGTGMAEVGGWAAIVAVVALQLYHSLGGRAGLRPGGWRVTLAVQVLLPLAPYAATVGDRTALLVGMVGFPAGSLLLLLTGRRAWLAFAVVSTSVGVLWLRAFPDDYDIATYFVGLVASTGIAVYGLSRLSALAERQQSTRGELVRAAVERERLRVARDTHDLLGLGLSAVALKCDLARRLIGRDDARARAELDALVRLAAQTRTEIQAVTIGQPGLSLDAELAAARDVLGSAGVDAEVRADPSGTPPSAEVDAVLATVLREAVTNVLRHATATRCMIDLHTGEDAVMLRIANDGVAVEPADPAREPEPQPADPGSRGQAGGRGLTSLAARAEALGGRLDARAEDGRFELTVRLPRPQ